MLSIQYDAEDVYQHLVAGRYDEASRIAGYVMRLPQGVRLALTERDYQQAICILDRDIYRHDPIGTSQRAVMRGARAE